MEKRIPYAVERDAIFDKNPLAISEIRDFLRKYNLPCPSDPLTFAIMAHKVRFNSTAISKESAEISRKWLIERNYQTAISPICESKA